MSTGPNTPDDPDRPSSEHGGPHGDAPPPPPGYGPGPQGYGPGPSGYGQAPPGYSQMPPPGQPMPGAPGGQPMPMRPDEEKLWAIAAHLGPLLVSFVAPLVVWLVFKDRSRFLDRHGKEALNMQISYLIYFLVAGFLVILLIGIILLAVVGVAWFVLMILATIKAANHEDYRYPAIIRFVS